MNCPKQECGLIFSPGVIFQNGGYLQRKRKGTPLLGEGDGEGEVRLAHPTHWSGPFTFILSPFSKGRGDEEHNEAFAHTNQAQYPVVGSTQNPFKLYNFPLVTPARLL